MADLNRAIQIDPNHARAYGKRGNLYYNRGETDLALADLNRAIQIDPQLDGAYVIRGAIYSNQGKNGFALSDLNQAIQIDPQSAIAHRVLGLHYKKMGDIKSTRQHLQKAQQLFISQGDTNSAQSMANILGSLLPAVAEIGKESKTKPQSIGIQNKQSAAELYDRASKRAFERYQQGNRESLERYNNTLRDIEERTEARTRARIAREQAVRARLDTGLVGYWKASVSEIGTPTNIFWNIKTDGTTAYVFQTSQGNGKANSTWNYADGIWYEGLSSGVTAKASIQWVSKDEFILTIIDNGNPQYAGAKRRFIRDRQATNRGLQNAWNDYGDANNGTNTLRSINNGYGSWNH